MGKDDRWHRLREKIPLTFISDFHWHTCAQVEAKAGQRHMQRQRVQKKPWTHHGKRFRERAKHLSVHSWKNRVLTVKEFLEAHRLKFKCRYFWNSIVMQIVEQIIPKVDCLVSITGLIEQRINIFMITGLVLWMGQYWGKWLWQKEQKKKTIYEILMVE